MNRLFDQRLIIGLGLVVVLLVVNAGVAYRTTRQLHGDAYWVAHTHEVLDSLDDLLSTMKDAETGQRGFLITGDERYLKPYDDALAALDGKVDRLKRLTEDDAHQQARIPRLQELIRAKLDELQGTIALRKGPGFEAAQEEVLTHLGRNTMDAIRAAIAEMRQQERGLLRDRQEANDHAYLTALVSGALASLLGLAAVGGFVWMLRRHLQDRLQAAGALDEQREWLRTTLTSIGDGVIATDAQGRVTFLNTVAQTLTGWSEEEAKGEPLLTVFQIVNEETRQPVENPALRSLKEGTIAGLANHTILIARDGSERAIDDSAAPIRHEKGNVAGVVLVFRDVTERKAMEEALRSSEAQFRQLADAMPQIVWAARPDGYLDYYNERWYEYTGFPRGEYGEQSWKPILHPDDVQRCVDTYFGCIQTEKPYQIEYRFKDRTTGGYRWFLGRALPARDGQGRIIRWFGTCTDIDDTKQAEERLRESERTLRQTTEALRAKEAELELVISRTPLLLIRCSRDLRYVFVNRATAGFLGRRAEEIIGRPIAEIMGPDAFATIQPYIERVLRGETVDFESEIPYARIGRRFMRVLYTPDRDERGQVIGWISTISDITERKQLERERDERAAELAVALGKRTEEAKRAEKAEQLLREADRRKDEFLATLAHELKNPLAPLRNAVELLRRADDNKPLLEQARGMMDRQVSQMVRLVDDLLDISRITQGKLQLRKERVNLADVLNLAVETARALIEAARHELTVTLPPQPVLVQADPVRLAQVFANLLNNAAKYTEKAGHIWLTAERRGDEAVVSVRDTGIGIAAEHLPHLFRMFAQVGSALERSQGGLGIGLALVKGLVELHGGTIEARSGGPGMGSEFTVHLPMVAVPAEEPQEPTGNDAMLRSGRTYRILVVDDLRDAADSMAMMLQMMGHDTRTAYDGLEAVQTAAAFRPDVVLLDIGLPKLNGYEAARRIRREPWGGNVALIALTGWGQEEDKRLSVEAGFDHHLTKPVEAAALEKLLALLLPHH